MACKFRILLVLLIGLALYVSVVSSSGLSLKNRRGRRALRHRRSGIRKQRNVPSTSESVNNYEEKIWWPQILHSVENTDRTDELDQLWYNLWLLEDAKKRVPLMQQEQKCSRTNAPQEKLAAEDKLKYMNSAGSGYDVYVSKLAEPEANTYCPLFAGGGDNVDAEKVSNFAAREQIPGGNAQNFDSTNMLLMHRKAFDVKFRRNGSVTVSMNDVVFPNEEENEDGARGNMIRLLPVTSSDGPDFQISCDLNTIKTVVASNRAERNSCDIKMGRYFTAQSRRVEDGFLTRITANRDGAPHVEVLSRCLPHTLNTVVGTTESDNDLAETVAYLFPRRYVFWANYDRTPETDGHAPGHATGDTDSSVVSDESEETEEEVDYGEIYEEEDSIYDSAKSCSKNETIVVDYTEGTVAWSRHATHTVVVYCKSRFATFFVETTTSPVPGDTKSSKQGVFASILKDVPMEVAIYKLCRLTDSEKQNRVFRSTAAPAEPFMPTFSPFDPRLNELDPLEEPPTEFPEPQ